jgi:alpha-L-fucosidase
MRGKTMKNWILAAMLLLGLLATPVRAADPADDGLFKETKEQRDARMKWWREARFGMFIHWGLYAVPGGEWKGKQIGSIGEWIMNNAQIPVAEYEQLRDQFNPVKFDAKEFVRIAKGAGMKYIVITSKHHDGFCLWDSKVSNYTIMSTPFKRDILKELSQACEAQGITLCFYHSIMDWHHPDAQAPHFPKYNGSGQKNPNFSRYVETYLKPQIRELLTNYGKIGVMWFDGEWIPEWSEEQAKDLYIFIKKIRPDIIINNRIGTGRKGMQGMTKEGAFAGDFGTPEQEIPATGFPGTDWESCMTMNDTWGFKKSDHNWKSGPGMIRMLIDTSSKGGNLLMNVGPTPEGEIPQPSQERLAEVGKWMKANSEAIYGSSASPFKKLAWGKCTQKPGKLYLEVFNWPADGTLLVPIRNKVSKAYLLTDPAKALATASADDGVKVTLPATAPDPVASVVVLEIDGPADAIASNIRPAADGSITLLASTADVIGTRAKLEKKGANPENIGYWTSEKDYVQWQALVTKPGEYEVVLTFSCAESSAGSEYSFEAGDAKIDAKVEGTGKQFMDFKTITLGKVTIDKAGETTFAVKPHKKPGLAVMDLRQIVLKPV